MRRHEFVYTFIFAVAASSFFVCSAVSPAAADDVTFGKSSESVDSPSQTVIDLRRNLLNPEVEALFFHSMNEIFETRNVAAGTSKWRLSRSNGVLPDYEFGGESFEYADFAERTKTNAFLVIRDGKIAFEDYRNYTSETERFSSFSMAKSIVSILIGAAIDKGFISSVDDVVEAYVPELKGTGYEGVSLRHVLQMRSGVDYEERYDFGEKPSLAAQIHEMAIVQNEERFTDRAQGLTRKTEPGTQFNYATMDTAVLGRVLESAVDKPLAEITSEWLWRPAGMERDGYWIADGPDGIGRALAGMGFNATLRDYGRIGQMMLNEGKARGRTIISEDWVLESTSIKPFSADQAEEAGGYGYQWWKLDTLPGAFAAVGLAGQYIYVHPASSTVIVKLSYYPIEKSDTLTRESMTFFEAIASSDLQ